MWSSAAVAHLLQGSTCCAFRDGILHALVVTSQMPKCIELLPCDWLISNLCYQAIEQVYLIKWLVSVCMCVYTVGMESIQTPLHFSLFVILQPFAKII